MAEFGPPTNEVPEGDNAKMIWESITKDRTARILEFVWGKVITFTVEELDVNTPRSEASGDHHG